MYHQHLSQRSSAMSTVRTGCWEWRRAKANGYGYVWCKKRKKVIPAHRLFYEIFVGLIPKNLELDHLCRNRICVNPLHLEAVTHRENCLRGNGASGINARKTHCPLKHFYSPKNTFIDNGSRRCLECGRIKSRRQYLKRKSKKCGL